MISDQEMDEFILRMRQYKGRGRREVDEDKLRKAFRQSITKTVGSLLQVTTSIMEEKEEETKEQYLVLVDDAESQIAAVSQGIASGLVSAASDLMSVDDAESQRAAVSRGIASAGNDPLTRAVYGDSDDLDDRQPELLPAAQSASSWLLSGLLASNSEDFDLASLKSAYKDKNNSNNRAKKMEKIDPPGGSIELMTSVELMAKKPEKQKKDPPTGFIELMMSMSTLR
jgi:hypothetical protein